MGRGYWLPPGAENLYAYDGFYVDTAAVYSDTDIESGWQRFLDNVCGGLTKRDVSYKKVCNWMPCDLGQSRFVLLESDYNQVIAEEADGYIAVYVIIPENKRPTAIAKRLLTVSVINLRDTLLKLYPGAISKRKNSQHIEKVG